MLEVNLWWLRQLVRESFYFQQNGIAILLHYPYINLCLSATAVYCEAMPPPRVLEISRTIAVQDEEDEQLVRLQRLIETFSARNRVFLNDAGKSCVTPFFDYSNLILSRECALI